MQVDRYLYGNFVALDIYTRSSDTGTKTNNTTYVSWVDILMSKIKTVIGGSVWELKSLSEDANQWSEFGSYTRAVVSLVITPQIAAPYNMEDFAGYNDNAVTPYISDAPASVSAVPGDASAIPYEVGLGELDWTQIGAITKVKGILKEGTTTYGTVTGTIASGTNTDDEQFLIQQINFTSSGSWVTNKTLTVYLELLNTANTKIADFVVPSFNVTFIPLFEPDIAAESIIDLAIVTWDTSDVNSYVNRGTLPYFQMEDIDMIIDDVRYTGIASVYIYKGSDTPVYFDDYNMASSGITISGNCPFDVDYNDTVILEFRYEGD